MVCGEKNEYYERSILSGSRANLLSSRLRNYRLARWSKINKSHKSHFALRLEDVRLHELN